MLDYSSREGRQSFWKPRHFSPCRISDVHTCICIYPHIYIYTYIMYIYIYVHTHHVHVCMCTLSMYNQTPADLGHHALFLVDTFLVVSKENLKQTRAFGSGNPSAANGHCHRHGKHLEWHAQVGDSAETDSLLASLFYHDQSHPLTVRL